MLRDYYGRAVGYPIDHPVNDPDEEDSELLYEERQREDREREDEEIRAALDEDAYDAMIMDLISGE